MNKLKFLPALLFPLALNAQLDKIKIGTTLAEMRKNYPGLLPDAESMTSWLWSKDSLEGLKGYTSYDIRMDTLSKYHFQSDFFAGPCNAYPHVDSTKYVKAITTAKKLHHQYTKSYGKPLEYHIQSALEDDSSRNKVFVFYAKWKKGKNELSVTVSRQGKKEKWDGYSPIASHLGCEYTLEILSVGTGKTFKKSCENGITGKQFKKIHPALAHSVRNFPDIWKVNDSIFPNWGTWRFSFIQGKLRSFTFNNHDGLGYSVGDSAYNVLRKRTLKLFGQAEKLYGRPDTLSKAMPQDYEDIPNKEFGHKTIYFDAEWKSGGNKLSIIYESENASETSDGGQEKIIPFLKIEINCGTPPEME